MIDILILAILGIGVGAFCLDVFGERGLESLRVDLLEHLALLAARGLPLAPGVGALAAERAVASKGVFTRRGARRLQRIAAGLQEHGSLATALADSPGLLAPDQLALVEHAEARGSLPAVLERLCGEEAERDAALHKALETGFYVVVLSALVLGITAFLTLVITPKFREISESMSLPHADAFGWVDLATWIYIGSCALCLVFCLPGQGGVRLRWRATHAVAGTPGLGRPVRRWLAARWLQRVGALLQHGATLPDALAHVAEAPGSTPGHTEAAQQAREGRPLGEVLTAGLGPDGPGLAPSLLLTIDRAGSLADGWTDGAERVAYRARRRLAMWGEALRPLPVVLCAAVVATHYAAVWVSINALQSATMQGVW